MRMPINGIQLNIEVQGSGPPLVLLHGLTDNLNGWERELPYLTPHFQTIAIDSRGHGRSDKPAQYTFQDHVDDVVAVLDALHVDTVALMGVSMGSYVAAGVAAQHPARVSRLVLIVGKAHGTTSSSARFLAEHAAEIEGKSPWEIQLFLFDRIFAPTTPPAVKAQLAEYGARQQAAGLVLTPDEMLAANRALEGFDLRPVLPRIIAPTLVISGRHDPLNPPAEGQVLADGIPHARFVVLDHSGHVPQVEEPERLRALIEDFLAG
jgi:3-oxoadipate enol-lactonase